MGMARQSIKSQSNLICPHSGIVYNTETEHTQKWLSLKTDCLHRSLKCRQWTPKGLPIPPWPEYKGVDPHIATCIHLAVENSWHPNTSLSTTYTEEATHPTAIGRRKTLPGMRLAHSSDHVHMSSRLCRSGSNTQRHQKQQHKQHA